MAADWLLPTVGAGVAQLEEQLIRNEQVSGSSPLAGSTLNNFEWEQ